MKNLLVLLVILGVVWYGRSKTRRPPVARPPEPPPAKGSITMAACAHCGVHVPAADLVMGQHAEYCSAEHLRLAEPG